MRLRFTAIIIVCFSILSCSKNCVLNYEIIGPEYEIPHFVGQNEILREYDKIEYDRYESVNVNKSEIPYVMKILHSQMSESNKATERMVNNLCNYSVQIAGVYDRDQKAKLIYLNFENGFIDYKAINARDEKIIGINGKETKFMLGHDGGDCCFQAFINTKTDKLIIIIVNGKA